MKMIEQALASLYLHRDGKQAAKKPESKNEL
jgi:hypothetical protein